MKATVLYRSVYTTVRPSSIDSLSAVLHAFYRSLATYFRKAHSVTCATFSR